MIIEKNSKVKILLRNNSIVEGIVQEWNDSIIKLLSLEDKSYLIITNPKQDIILIKIYLNDTIKDNISKDNISKDNISKDNISKDNISNIDPQAFKELSADVNDPLRNKKLAELKILMAEQEKQIIINKLKTHHIGDVKVVNYNQPSFKK